MHDVDERWEEADDAADDPYAEQAPAENQGDQGGKATSGIALSTIAIGRKVWRTVLCITKMHDDDQAEDDSCHIADPASRSVVLRLSNRTCRFSAALRRLAAATGVLGEQVLPDIELVTSRSRAGCDRW